MRIIKKFDQYIKENLDQVNDPEIEDVNDMEAVEGEDTDNLDEMEWEEESEMEDIHDEVGEVVDLEYDEEGDNSPLEDDDFPQEEEGGEYVGQRLLAELADRLGSTVTDNSVEYDGKIINYFSETESFHVDGKKFETIDEVLEHLADEDNSGEEEDFDDDDQR